MANGDQQARTILDRGRTVGYLVAGGGPTVVLLPPGASTASVWRGVGERLEGDHRTIAVNPAGYGATHPWPQAPALKIADEAAAVAAILDAESADHRVHLVGHSYGGVVALDLALAAPGRLASLVLIEPAAYAVLEAAGETALAEEVGKINGDFISAVRAGRAEAAIAGYFDYYNNAPGAWAKLEPRARSRFVGHAANVAAGLAATHANPSRLEDYAGLETPTLVLAGALTDPLHARLSRLVAAAVPGAALDTVAGAGHMLSLTHPQEVARRIAAHVAARPA